MTKAPDTIRVLVTCTDASLVVLTFVTTEFGRGDLVRKVHDPSTAAIDRELARSATGWDPAKLPIVGWRIIEESDIPIDRTFRNAWKDDVTSIVVDMPRARDIHRDHLRELRAPILIALDVAYLRAFEIGDQAEADRIVARKQALRVVTDDPAIEAAQTPDELKAVIPAALTDE